MADILPTAERIKQLLDGPTKLREVFKLEREEIAQEVLETEPKDKQEREYLYCMAKALDRLERRLQTKIDNAKLGRQ